MTTAKKIVARGDHVKNASKHSKGFIETIVGYVFLIPMFLIWAVTSLLKWFAYNMDTIAMGLLGLFSFGWAVENYFIVLGYSDLLGSLGSFLWGLVTFRLDWALMVALLTAFFVATLIQSVQYRSSKERLRAKALADVDNHTPNGNIIWLGWLFYFVEGIIAFLSIKTRMAGGGVQGFLLAVLIAWVSVWGFEYAADWIENRK